MKLEDIGLLVWAASKKLKEYGDVLEDCGANDDQIQEVDQLIGELKEAREAIATEQVEINLG